MKEVPNPLADRTVSNSPVSADQDRPVTHVAVELESSLPAVRVLLRDPENHLPFAFLLSPPAAKQLAELLEQAVDDYLHGNQPPEFSLDQFVGGTE